MTIALPAGLSGLAFALFLFGTETEWGSVLGVRLWAAAALGVLILTVGRRVRLPRRALIVATALPLLMLVRVLVSGAENLAPALAACALAGTAGVIVGCCDDATVDRQFAIVATAFVWVNLLFGQAWESNPDRWAGVVGHPNRLALLVCLGFGPVMLSNRPCRSLKVLWSVGAVWLLALCGSLQALPQIGLAVIFLAGPSTSASDTAGKGNRKLLSRTGVSVAGLLALTWLSVRFGEKIVTNSATLSGRVALYEGSLTEIDKAIFSGLGTNRVSVVDAVERSSHNSILGVLLVSGLVGLVVLGWLVKVLGSYAVSGLAGRVGAWWVLSIALGSMVQGLEAVPIVWFLIGVVAARAHWNLVVRKSGNSSSMVKVRADK
jgi:hypothetical protein